MYSDEPEKLADMVESTMKKEMQRAYHEGYTKGVQDGPKAKAVADELMGVAKPVVPQPCVKGIDMRTMKKLFLKLHEEILEYEFEIMQYMDTLEDSPEDVLNLLHENPEQHSFRIAEEGADVQTMIATIDNAIGIIAKKRFEAQAYVNKHNHERGRF